MNATSILVLPEGADTCQLYCKRKKLVIQGWKTLPLLLLCACGLEERMSSGFSAAHREHNLGTSPPTDKILILPPRLRVAHAVRGLLAFHVQSCIPLVARIFL